MVEYQFGNSIREIHRYTHTLCRYMCVYTCVFLRLVLNSLIVVRIVFKACKPGEQKSLHLSVGVFVYLTVDELP